MLFSQYRGNQCNYTATTQISLIVFLVVETQNMFKYVRTGRYVLMKSFPPLRCVFFGTNRIWHRFFGDKICHHMNYPLCSGCRTLSVCWHHGSIENKLLNYVQRVIYNFGESHNILSFSGKMDTANNKTYTTTTAKRSFCKRTHVNLHDYQRVSHYQCSALHLTYHLTAHVTARATT